MFPTTRQTETNFTGTMVVVENKFNLEREIDQHVQKIQTLIQRLSPSERQKYFNGMLAFILNGQVAMTETNTATDPDYSKLSENEFTLLKEMSAQIQELYHVIGDNQ